MAENRILLDNEQMQETKYKATDFIEEIRSIAEKVDSLQFGVNGGFESKGPCSEKMQGLTIDLKDTINCMADTGERLLLFLLQAGINLEEMDNYLGKALGGGAAEEG